MKSIFAWGTVILLLVSCQNDKLEDPIDTELLRAIGAASATGSPDYYILPLENDLAHIPAGINNPLSEAKVALGKNLFFETSFSTNEKHPFAKATFSCSSCHVPTASFLPGRIQGIADGGWGFGLNGERRDQHPDYAENEMDVQGIRPLPLINVSYVKNTSWSGQFGANGVNEGTEAYWGVNDPGTRQNHLGYDGLETQNIAGLDLHRMVYNKKTIEDNGYKNLFDHAFPDMDESKRYGPLTASLAISSYLRQVLSNRAPFQDYLRGNCDALTKPEKEGAKLFFGKAGCYRCHNEPNLGSAGYYGLGVNDLIDAGAYNTSISDKKNLGRGGFTDKEEDYYKFRVPQLYNLSDYAFFFHGSSKASIKEVVDYFNQGTKENNRVPDEYIASQFHPLNLTNEEVDKLVLFLQNGLYDAEMDRYIPASVVSGNCFPNNDPVSRTDLGCQ